MGCLCNYHTVFDIQGCTCTQKRLGVSDEFLSGAMGGGGGGGGGQMGAPAAEEVVVKDIFEVKLKAFDPKSKIKIIKEVRALTGLGLKEVRSVVSVWCLFKSW